MKSVIAASLLAAAGVANAKALLALFEDEVTVGKSYRVEWLQDAKDTHELALVQKTSYGWKQIESLFENKATDIPGGNFTWNVSEFTPTGEGFGLWLSGTNYADLTSWFDIVAAEKEKHAEELRV